MKIAVSAILVWLQWGKWIAEGDRKECEKGDKRIQTEVS